MAPISYVSRQSLDNAEAIEQRFQNLPAMAGVIFVGVTPTPIEGGNCTHFNIFLGLSKKLDTDIGFALVQQVVQEELKKGLITVSTKVVRGYSGACRDERAQKPNTDTSAINDAV